MSIPILKFPFQINLQLFDIFFSLKYLLSDHGKRILLTLFSTKNPGMMIRSVMYGILHKRVMALPLVALVLLFSGCADKTLVILLPDSDGKVGHITVSNDAGSVDITEAAEATLISGRQSLPASQGKLSDDKIAKDFSVVLSTLPDQPAHFILYFKKQSTALIDEAEEILPQIFESVESRKSQDIRVIGHTDTAGDSEYNLWLSQKRALTIE